METELQKYLRDVVERRRSELALLVRNYDGMMVRPLPEIEEEKELCDRVYNILQPAAEKYAERQV